jgi:diguanylate cyclase (GGDEF)-like protein
MNIPGDLDLQSIERREWQLWSLTLAILIVFGGITVATFFFMLDEAYQGWKDVQSVAFKSLWGLFILIVLFCLYVLQSRLSLARMRLLLVDTSQMIASNMQLNTLLPSFARRIADASAASFCQIALLVRSNRSLKLLAAQTVAKLEWQPQIGKVYPLAKMPACLQVIETIQAMILREKDIMLLQGDGDAHEILTGRLRDVSSVLLLPMVTKDRVLGVVILGNVRKRSHFASSKIVLAKALAKQTATAIDHARLLEETEKTSVSLLQATLESTADGILVVDRSKKIISYNKQFAQMWRIPEEVLASRNDDQALTGVLDQLKQPEQFLIKMRDLYAQPEAWSYDIIEFKDGRVFERFSQPQLLDGLPIGRVWSFRDVTEQRRALEALERQAIRDSLTNLYNRRYFEERAEQEIAHARRNKRPLAILLCDLDDFKTVNDTHGHYIGDQVLKAAAGSIQQSTRETDLVFRWGGDEIVVLLSDTTREGILIASERIREGIHKVSKAARLDLDISIGVALYPDHGVTIDDLIRLADRALYIAKQGGGKVHIGEDEYHLDEHTIKVVFQPIMDIRSNEIIGFEALSRDPQDKLSVLELFKKYHAVGQIQELKRLCFVKQLKTAERAGLKRVFLNVDFNLIRHLGTVSKPSGIDVILEISEMEALHDLESYLMMTRVWREQGFKFAIDDFGAGFISLPFIAQLVPDYIKVDRSSILQSVSSKKFRKFSKELVQALQGYTTSGIIAEGIETEEELEVAKRMGIYIAQGFLFGKPKELN